jgi:hypothetical protein
MGNLVWTGILYFSTFSIVFVTFRCFIAERRNDAKGAIKNLVEFAKTSQIANAPPRPWEQKRRA